MVDAVLRDHNSGQPRRHKIQDGHHTRTEIAKEHQVCQKCSDGHKAGLTIEQLRRCPERNLCWVPLGTKPVVRPTAVPSGTSEARLEPSGSVYRKKTSLNPDSCSVCGSKGFPRSVTGTGCTFCDGTEGGNPPEPYSPPLTSKVDRVLEALETPGGSSRKTVRKHKKTPQRRKQQDGKGR